MQMLVDIQNKINQVGNHRVLFIGIEGKFLMFLFAYLIEKAARAKNIWPFLGNRIFYIKKSVGQLLTDKRGFLPLCVKNTYN